MRRFSLVLYSVLATATCGDGGTAPPTITAVLVAGDSTVALAGTQQLSATAMAGGSPIATGVTFLWTSSDTALATVSPSGLVSGRARGTATISAHAVLNGTGTGVSGTHAVRVRIGSIALTPSDTLQFSFLDDTLAVSVEARDAADAPVPGISFAFQASDTAVVRATPGSATTALVVSVASGTALVVVTGDGVSDSVAARVRQVPVSLSIAPDTATFDRLGTAVTPTVTAEDARGDPVGPGAFAWTSQNAGVAAVSPTTGAITSRGAGSTRVIASADTLADTVHVVVQQVPARVRLHPRTIDSSRILVAGTMRFVDSVFDANDSLIRSPAPLVTWSTTSAAATVDTAGAVTGGSLGATYVKAASGAAADSVRIEVVTAATTLDGGVQPILTTACAVSGCHIGPSGPTLPDGQDLRAGNAWANIVNVDAVESVLKRVRPFEPDFSYLVHKIQGTHLVPPASGSGLRMPHACVGAGCLTQGQINVIRNWVLQGALNN